MKINKTKQPSSKTHYKHLETGDVFKYMGGAFLLKLREGWVNLEMQ